MEIVEWFQLLSSLAVVVGVWLAFLQLRKMSKSLRLAQQGNTVNVISHCANRYETIMRDLPALKTDVGINRWWYRYWDLHTEEFSFFKKGLLDPDIFELWMNELATVYQESPEGKLQEVRSINHQKYLRATLPAYSELRSFFHELGQVSEET